MLQLKNDFPDFFKKSEYRSYGLISDLIRNIDNTMVASRKLQILTQDINQTMELTKKNKSWYYSFLNSDGSRVIDNIPLHQFARQFDPDYEEEERAI